MEAKEIVEVAADQQTVACDGGREGHPRVYLAFGDKNEVTCPYCGTVYRRENTGR